MGHFFVVTMVPKGTKNIVRRIEALMLPYQDCMAVKPYKRHYGDDDVARMAKHYGISPTNLEELASKMPDWERSDGGVDDNGMYVLTDENPNRRFDWWVIGGRWDGMITGTTERQPRRWFQFSKTREDLKYNSIPADELLLVVDHERTPAAAVTPDGKWHEIASWDGLGADNTDPASLENFKTLLERNNDCIAVGLDCHL